MTRLSFAISLSLACGCLQAQWFKQPTVGIPRTPDGKPNLTATVPKAQDGKPDLSGVWTLQQTGGGMSQLKPADIQPWAEALSKQRQEDFGGPNNPNILCLPSGNVGGLARFIQTPGLLVMLGEDLVYRQVFLDGRELPKDPNPAWMGYSVGHWEGDTLVVESSGYNDRTWLERGYPHTENLRKVERFHRRDFGHLDVDVTFSDPKIYAKPWTAKLEGVFTADTDLIEYVCAENEKDRTHLVGKESDDKKNAVTLAPEILSKYVGTYEFNAKELGVPGPDILTFKVALKDGALEIGFGDGPKAPMTPLSETTFTGVGGTVEFGKGDNGEVTHLAIRIAEGDFRANRKKAAQ
ncbi:MAG TPA: DUF3471 domain-containing protein [Bryobacteraceae bacterium]|jgi:hypothetical protein|nr:DUF3471 domain-containing protein [Bryobacteraceae bacterium]